MTKRLKIGVVAAILITVTPLNIKAATQQDKILEVIRSEQIKQEDIGEKNNVQDTITELRKQKVGETFEGYVASVVGELMSQYGADKFVSLKYTKRSHGVTIDIRGYRGSIVQAIDWVDAISPKVRELVGGPFRWDIWDMTGELVVYNR